MHNMRAATVALSLAIGLGFAAAPACAQVEKPALKFTLDWLFQAPQAPYTLAAEKGYFKAEGLEVTVDRGSGSGASVQHVEFIRVGGAVTCSGLPIVRWQGEARLREVMRLLEAEGVYIADPHTWVVEDGGKKSINPRHVELKLTMDPAGLLNPGKLRAWDERDRVQRKSVFWNS